MVCVRVRPVQPQEVWSEDGDTHPREIWSYSPNAIIEDSDMTRKAHAFDRVFAPGTTNEEVYERCAQRIVHRALQGTNGTVCAYGQTGSGKTFSMLGSDRDPGIVPRCIHDVFEHIEAAAAGGAAQEFLVRVSYLEVYNEEINDLLQGVGDAGGGASAGSGGGGGGRGGGVAQAGRNLKILRDDPARGAIIEGLLELIVTDREQARGAWRGGGRAAPPLTDPLPFMCRSSRLSPGARRTGTTARRPSTRARLARTRSSAWSSRARWPWTRRRGAQGASSQAPRASPTSTSSTSPVSWAMGGERGGFTLQRGLSIGCGAQRPPLPSPRQQARSASRP